MIDLSTRFAIKLLRKTPYFIDTFKDSYPPILINDSTVKCLNAQGMSAEEAQEEYMKTLQLWSGYGTTLYSVTVSYPILWTPCISLNVF